MLRGAPPRALALQAKMASSVETKDRARWPLPVANQPFLAVYQAQIGLRNMFDVPVDDSSFIGRMPCLMLLG